MNPAIRTKNSRKDTMSSTVRARVRAGMLELLEDLNLPEGTEAISEKERDYSEDTGFLSSCTRLMEGVQGLVTPCALGFSPHSERKACRALLWGAHTVEALL